MTAPNPVQRSERARRHIINTCDSWGWAHCAIYAIGIAAAVVVWVTR